MAYECSPEMLKSTLTFKFDVGEAIDDEHKYQTAILKSKDGHNVGTFPSGVYKYYDDERIGYYNFLSDKLVGKNLFLKVEKDAQEKLKLFFCDENGDKVHNLHLSDIKGVKNINLEQYVGAEKPQIRTVKGDDETVYLHDLQDNKIGSLVTEALVYYNQFLEDDIMYYSTKQMKDYLPFYNEFLTDIFISKTEDKYQLQKIDIPRVTEETAKNIWRETLNILNDRKNAPELYSEGIKGLPQVIDKVYNRIQKHADYIIIDADNLNINLDKIVKNSPCFQIKALNNEKVTLSNQVDKLTQKSDQCETNYKTATNEYNQKSSEFTRENRKLTQEKDQCQVDKEEIATQLRAFQTMPLDDEIGYNTSEYLLTV